MRKDIEYTNIQSKNNGRSSKETKNKLLGIHQNKKLLNSEGKNKIKRQPREWEKVFANDIM